MLNNRKNVHKLWPNSLLNSRAHVLSPDMDGLDKKKAWS